MQPFKQSHALVGLGALLLACGRGGEVHDLGALAAAAEEAAAMIAERQTSAGTWRTDYTSGTSYFEVAQQLDVWTPVIMVDLLEPVSEAAGMKEILARACDYLRGQIEPNGLVRYEGLGSELLPDSDDTTLIWRVAPRDVEAEIPGVLEVLREYRSEDGLYRIWLSPGGRTGHSAVGDDPNPADIQTQIHILQFLAIHAPAAAAELCAALADHVSDRDLWTYSESSPWLYHVREIDLRALGCDLPRPEALLRTELDHQQPYMDLSRLLRDLLLAEDPAPLKDDVLDALTLIAADNFARVNRTPMLIYHNDLTSTVARFYWSKDLTLALWMRLYHEAERRLGG
jgi:hypothetical protein